MQVSEEGRFSLHELLRQYAAEKLREWGEKPGHLSTLREKFCAFYLGLIQAKEAALFGPTPYLTTMELQMEWGNIQQAWEWAIDDQRDAKLADCLDGLFRYSLLVGFIKNLETLVTVDRLQPESVQSETALHLSARLLVHRAAIQALQRAYQPAWELASQALTIGQTLQNEWVQGESYFLLGHILHLDGFYTQAADYYFLALQHARESHNLRLETQCLIKLDFALTKTTEYNALAIEKARALNDAILLYEALHQSGVSAIFLGHYGVARTHFETLSQQMTWLPESHPARSRLLGDLGEAYRLLGDYARALESYQQALELIRFRGDQASECSLLDGLSRLYRCTEMFEEARQMAEMGLSIARKIPIMRDQFFLGNSLGHIHLQTQAWETAYQTYQQALQIGLQIENEAACMESYAGLAEAAYFLDDLDAAQAHVETILNFLKKGALDHSTESLQVYLKCFWVLDALQDPRAPDILNQAYTLLQAQANQIDDVELRNLFLTQEATNKTILEYWNLKERFAIGLIGS